MRAASRTAQLMLRAAMVVVVMVVGVTVAAGVSSGGLVLAHDDADDVGTTPAAGETVTSVDVIVVDFGAPVDGARFEVVDPTGVRVEGATATDSAGVATFTPSTAATDDGEDDDGEYTVRYAAQSADGHLISGEFAFTVGPVAASDDDAGVLRRIAGIAAIVAILSIAVAANVARRKRAGAEASTHDAAP